MVIHLVYTMVLYSHTYIHTYICIPYSLYLFSANLYEFADLLIKHGVVNAINLDGGGSSQLVEDGLLVSYPSDHW